MDLAHPDLAAYLESISDIPLLPVEETFFKIKVGARGLLVPATFYCEVADHVQVSPLPMTQPWFSGLINLRGNLVPVIDLHRLLDEDVADPKKRRLFTLDKGEKAVGLWIDGLPEMLGTSREPLEQLPALPTAIAPYAYSGFVSDGQVWLNIEFEAFFKALGRQVASG
jgi:twitching motility protein PilI